MIRMHRWTKVVALAGVAGGLLGGTHALWAQAQTQTRGNTQTSRAAPAAPATGASAAIPTTVEFNRDIRPILSDKCYKCHGPATQKGGLRLDMEDSAKAELTSGSYAIVP